MSTITAIILSIGLSFATIIGDLLIKEASLHTKLAGWRWLLAGALIYATTAIGWFFVMRKVEFSILGAVYSLVVVVSLALIGALFFKEQLAIMEVVGLVLAVISLVILFRFQ